MSTPAPSSPPTGSPPTPAGPPKWLVEYGPLLVFLGLYRVRDIYWATGGFMLALVFAMALAYRADGKLPPTLIFTGALVLPLGVLTLVLHDPRFMYVKPTVVWTVSALVLLGGLARGKALLRSLLGAQLQLTDEGWRALSLRFALFSLLLAALNEFVWRSYTPDRERIWVLFKFPGIPILMAVFMATQFSLFQRHAPPPQD